MSNERENKLWESIRRWLGKITGKKPDVVVVIGLNKNSDGDWDVNWKASHWIDDCESGQLPSGIQGSIVREMLKDGLGDKLGDIVVNRGIPALVGAIADRVRKG